MKDRIESMLEVGKRTTLERGDKFRATAGPYFESDNGSVPMVERGPFKFLEVIRHGKRRAWVRAINKDGSHCLLYIGPMEKSKSLPNLVNRPYRIVGRIGVRKTKRQRSKT